MNNHNTDKFWNGAALGCAPDLAPWLRDRGSLTQRIQQRCTRFAVDKVRTGLARIALDESALLGIAPQQLAYSREVFLYADDQPVVFAHSALAPEHLRSAWSAVRTLGNKPLGALLFAHPLVERKPLHYKALRNTHPLYQRAATVLRNHSINSVRGECFSFDPSIHRTKRGTSLDTASPARDERKMYRTESSDSYSGSLSDLPPRLWARRSLFYLHDAPLLVTEVFLPGILLLTNPA